MAGRCCCARRIARSVCCSAWRGCFTDARDPQRIEHSLSEMLAQRIYGLALGYEDLNDHEQLRHDPLLAVLAGQRETGRTAGGQEHAEPAGTDAGGFAARERYHKISYSAQRWIELLVEIFLESHTQAARSRSCSIWTRPTSRCTAIRRGDSSTATTTLLLSAAVHLLRRSPVVRAAAAGQSGCGGGQRGGSRAHRGADSAARGRRCGSCCAATPASAARS